MMRTLISILATVCLTLGARAQQTVDVPSGPWDPEVELLLAQLPVQEAGRVKPLDTLLQFALYRMQHKRKVYVPDEASFGQNADRFMQPIEWGLNTMFFPAWSHIVPVFTIEDTDILTSIGLDELRASKKKRDRFSFSELEPGIAELFAKAREFAAKDAKSRSLHQGMIVGLAHAVREYRMLSQSLDFARARFAVPDGPVRDLFDGAAELRTSDVMRSMAGVRQLYDGHQDDEGVTAFAAAVNEVVQRSHYLAWIPPSVKEQEEWLSVADLFEFCYSGIASEDQIECVERFERLIDALDSPAESRAAAVELHAKASSLASARGEYDKIEAEVSYYRIDYYHKAMISFFAGFLLLAISWLWGWRWLPIGSGVLAVIGEVFLVTGIVERCLIRGRPPITNLYDTILFIAAVVVLVALIQEFLSRRKVGLLIANVLGAGGMLLSYAHEIESGTDTMEQLLAVLDTNFYLATHVTTVTMGYAAGLLAAGLAYVFVIAKVCGLRKGDRAFFQNLSRMVYGCVCFGLLFSTFGTIWGGVWANDSWGRFWGWDPKENGALLIVLWFLMTLHARLGGYIRQWGMCLMAVIGGAVVAFSWWGVNLLGVGLHSYGFTSGVKNALFAFYYVSAFVFALGVVGWAMDRAKGSAPTGAKA